MTFDPDAMRLADATARPYVLLPAVTHPIVPGQPLLSFSIESRGDKGLFA